jgi:hypothetical protein
VFCVVSTVFTFYAVLYAGETLDPVGELHERLWNNPPARPPARLPAASTHGADGWVTAGGSPLPHALTIERNGC